MRRKKAHEEEGSAERWLVSYADFITLLFAFFVVMYATSQKDIDKQEEFQESMKKYLLKVSGTSAGGASGITKRVKDFSQKDTLLKTPIKNFRKLKSANTVETLKVKKKIEKNIQEKIKKESIAKYIRDIEVKERGVLISLYAGAIFSNQSAKIYSKSAGFLDQLGELISEFKGPIHILGHSSKNNLSKTKYSSEWEFSSDRSVKLLRYLSKRFDISYSRLVSSAYGDSQPLYNQNKEGTYKNNRIEILLVTQ